MVDIERVIVGYMQSHRRINIPQLGALLLRSESGEVIFSEFANGDDGVLRGELVRLGETEISAMAQIEGFVDRVRAAIDGGDGFFIEGVGRLCRGESGAIVLAGAEMVAVEAVEAQEVAQVSPSQQIVEEEEAYEEGVEYDEVVYESESGERVVERKRGGRKIDPFMVFLVVAISVAIALFASGFVMAWSVGSITVPEPVDRVMLKVFGDGMDAVEVVDVE